MLPVALYVHEALSLTLIEDHRWVWLRTTS
jgi:hypothetical protein